MSTLALLPLLVMMTDAEPKWEVANRKNGITVYARERAGSGVKELKVHGLIDAPPQAVWALIRDYPNYKTNMPYVKESEVIAREGGDRVIHFYSLMNAPLVSSRDYAIRIVDVSEWKDGEGYLMNRWTASDKAPPEREGVVRVTVAEGHWRLEPREEGQKTFLEYYVYTDPGGSVPKWMVNRANTIAVPDLFQRIAELARESKNN